MQLAIVKLKDHPRALDAVSAWIDREWGAFSGRTPAQTRERFEQELRHSPSPNAQLPISCVALVGERAVGVATLRDRDSVDWDPSVKPWICNVFVAEEARGKEVGARLCRSLESVASELEYRHIYLATVMAQDSLYHRLGYECYRTCQTSDHPMYLMRRAIGG